eukprot:scaffold4567_cov276-Chaetoceros_neogracile.AAC.4
MGFLTVFNHHLPPLCCALLATASLVLSFLSATTCQFLKISYPAHSPTDGFISTTDELLITDPNDDYGKHNVGIFCESSYFNREGDLMWNLSRYFLIAAFVMHGISFLYAWGLSTFVKPTFKNWKILSVASIVTAGVQIPSFLFYTIKPCQIDNAQCSAGAGFFMLLWSIIIMTSLTVLTQCFNYPLWRHDMERWKIQEHSYPMYSYEQEGTFDIEEDLNYNLDAVHKHFNAKPTYRNVPNAKAQNEDNANGTIYPIQELNTHKRRKKGKKSKESVSFYMLNDEDDIASQCLSGCLSGMSATASPVNRDGLASLLKEEASYNDEDEESQLIFMDAEDDELPVQDSSYNEEWGEEARRREDAKVLPESDSSPSRSPSRRKMKKNKDNVTYIVLEEHHDDGGGDSDCESPSLNYGNHLDSRLRGVDSVNGSCNDYHTSREESDIYSTISSLGNQLHVIDLATGARELIVADAASYHSASISDFEQTPSPTPTVSDGEKQDDELSFVGTEERFDIDNYAIQNDLGYDYKHRLQQSKSDVLVLDSQKLSEEKVGNKIEDAADIRMLPSDMHLASLLAKFTEIDNSKNKTMDDDFTSEKSVEWHDVLDEFNEDNSQQHLNLVQCRSEDFDDEKGHIEMMKALNQKTDKDIKSVDLNLPQITRYKYMYTPDIPHANANSNSVIGPVVVSDDEDEPSSLGLSSARSYLYPDEVEV